MRVVRYLNTLHQRFGVCSKRRSQGKILPSPNEHKNSLLLKKELMFKHFNSKQYLCGIDEDGECTFHSKRGILNKRKIV